MSEKYLHRQDAPFSEKVWEKIDETVLSAAQSQLCGRRLIPTKGPYGLAFKALSSGDKPIEEKKTEAVKMMTGCFTPLIMLQAEFSLAVRDIAAFEQSGLPLDLAEAAQAAMDCARQEDNLIFNGCTSIGLKGLLNAGKSSSVKLKPWDEVGEALHDITQAVTTLDKSGFHGPYALGLCPKLYNLLFRRYPQGNATEIEHLRQVITDGIVKASTIPSGGVLLDTGAAFASIVLGQDLMTGFVGPAGGRYEFIVSESVTLRLTQPESVCVLKK
jgi:uncharacterized linocin/CFP29 family protein